VHEAVFQGIASDKLKAYAVWEPILRTDNLRGARKATTILPDSRVRHYWVEGQEVGEIFQPALGLKDEVAWDVYLVYPPEVEWRESRPPKPSYFMHQLHELPSARRLDAKTLATQIRGAIPIMATAPRSAVQGRVMLGSHAARGR
jgi:hypothetical protein